ncbi:MAG: hypothetical protein K1X72_04275 [Pyrinomonadaceae bacterium]|nr:hypothetical protein [Pyrinomonadaceae bacterium]
MSDKAIEVKLFEFFTEQIQAATPDSPIYQAALLDTIHREIRDNQLNGIAIGDVTSTFAPYGDSVKEFDGFTLLVCFAKVIGSDKTNRQPAVQKVFEIQQEVIRLLFKFPSLNNRNCDVHILRSARTAQGFDAEDYAVANIPVVVDESGEYDFSRQGY